MALVLSFHMGRAIARSVNAIDVAERENAYGEHRIYHYAHPNPHRAELRRSHRLHGARLGLAGMEGAEMKTGYAVICQNVWLASGIVMAGESHYGTAYFCAAMSMGWLVYAIHNAPPVTRP